MEDLGTQQQCYTPAYSVEDNYSFGPCGVPAPPCEHATCSMTEQADGHNESRTHKESLAARAAGALVRQLSARSATFVLREEPFHSAGSSITEDSSATSSPDGDASVFKIDKVVRPNIQSKTASSATFHSTTAISHTEDGEWSLALRSYNRALVLQRAVYGQDSPQAAETLNGIGLCLMNLAGQDADETDGMSPSGECGNLVRFAECAFRESLWIRRLEYGRESEEAYDVETNLELLLGDSWEEEEQPEEVVDEQVKNIDNADDGITSQSTPSARTYLSTFARALRHLSNGGDNGKPSPRSSSLSRISADETAHSISSSCGSAGSLSSEEEQVALHCTKRDTSVVSGNRSLEALFDVKLEGSMLPSTASRSGSKTPTLSHSTGSFGEVDKWSFDTDDEVEDDLVRGA